MSSEITEVNVTVIKQNMLKNIPKVDRVLEWPQVRPLLGQYPRPEVLL
ncbi:MAG TPA: hypothetical protein DCZ63_04535, partial [Geobacter sp.]|nr:hypothetical protein [Geobacter sp.]